MSDTGFTLRSGDTVGDYTVERLLGEGGLERMYLAVTGGGSHVTVKVPRFEPSTSAEFLRRFERQVATASRVAHPHVVAMLDSGRLPSGVPFVVEEYIAGGSLRDLIEQGPLDIDAAVRICNQSASGLDALHAARIIHRCLTPACIFLDERDGAKVGGFGLAKDRDASELTRAGHTVGAAHYVAPEQIRGQDVSPATDVYALGCVLYEALTGAPPFAGEKGMKVLWAHMQSPPPDPRVARPAIPADVSWAVVRGLAKTPAERPATATTFARIVQVAWEGARLRGDSGSSERRGPPPAR